MERREKEREREREREREVQEGEYIHIVLPASNQQGPRVWGQHSFPLTWRRRQHLDSPEQLRLIPFHV